MERSASGPSRARDAGNPGAKPSWLSVFLAGRGLTRPDARPLHRYAINDAEFAAVERLLQRDLCREAASVPSGIGPHLVLWGAEWFRRAFAGGHWTWETLTGPFGCAVEQGLLRDLAERGLRHWGRPVRVDGRGRQFLLSIAAEGGLPLKLIAGESGPFKAYLGRVLRETETFGGDGAAEIAGACADRLPHAFRTPEIFALTGDLAGTIAGLRRSIPGEFRGSDPLGWLDRNRAAWRRDLPLRLDDAALTTLLAETIAAPRGTATGATLAAREIVRRGDGWRPGLVFAADATLTAALFGAAGDALQAGAVYRLRSEGGLADEAPRLLFTMGQSEGNAWRVRAVGGSALSIPYPLDLPAMLALVADGRRHAAFEAPGAPCLRGEEGPTLWRAETLPPDDGPPERLVYAGTEAIKTRQPRLYVLSPDGGMPRTRGDLAATPAGDVAGAGPLYALSGDGEVELGDWVRVRTCSEREDRSTLHPAGKTLPNARGRHGEPLFLGWPDLYGETNDAVKRVPPAEARWRWPHEKSWRALDKNAPPLGRAVIGWFAGDALRARCAVSLVPPTLAVSGSTPDAGAASITLSGLPSTITPRIEHSKDMLTDGWKREDRGRQTIDLRTSTTPPARITIALLAICADTGVQTLGAVVPYPQSEGIFVAPDGTIADNDARVCVRDLAGWRVQAPPGRKSHLQIRLGDRVVTAPITDATPLPLFEADITALLAAQDDPDAEARLRVISDGRQGRRLRAIVHEGALRVDYLGRVWFEGAAWFALNQKGTNAPRPGLRAVNLPKPELSRDLEAVTLRFDPSTVLGDDPGPWLLFSRSRAPCLRPVLWHGASIGTNTFDRSRPAFIAAVAERRPKVREMWFEKVLEGLIESPSGADSQVWVLIEKLLNEVDPYVPLSCLEVVSGLQAVPSAATTLLFRASGDRLASRLEFEAHSRLFWGAVSHDDWAQGLSNALLAIKRDLDQTGCYTSEAALREAKHHLASRVETIALLKPEIKGHLTLAMQANRLGSLIPQDLRLPIGGAEMRGFYEGEIHKAAEEMIRRSSDANLPILKDYVRPALPSRLTTRFDSSWHDLLSAPFLAAEISAGTQSGCAPSNFFLRQCRLYDLVYFETALPLAVAWTKCAA